MVGAPGNEQAYLFRRSGSSWGDGLLPSAETAILAPSDGLGGDRFGYAADMTDAHLVIGTENGAAVYLYSWDGSSWGSGKDPSTQSGKLLVAGAVGGDGFGSAVAVGRGWAAVGAAAWDESGTNAGGVFVFQESASWEQVEVRLKTPAAAGDELGFAVAIDGDTAAVSAIMKDSERGAVYVVSKREER